MSQAKLVSYHDPHAGLSDDERSPIPMDLESDEEGKEEGEEGLQEQVDLCLASVAVTRLLLQDEKERSHIMAELWQVTTCCPDYLD